MSNNKFANIVINGKEIIENKVDWQTASIPSSVSKLFFCENITTLQPAGALEAIIIVNNTLLSTGNRIKTAIVIIGIINNLMVENK